MCGHGASASGGHPYGRARLVEFEIGLGLVWAQAAGGDIGLEIVFTLDGSACHAAEHGELADVVEGVGDGTLKEFFGGGVEGFGTGEIVVELLEGSEKAVDFVLPAQGVGIVPCGLALGHGERPIEQITEVSEDLRGCARGFRGAEIGEGVWCAVEDFCTAIGDGGEAVTQEIASAGVRRSHSGVNLAASVREEKMILREAAGREKPKP